MERRRILQGEQRKKSRENQEKKETSREPTPSLTPSSELGPKLRHRAGPPKVNEESRYGRTGNGTIAKNNLFEKQHKLSQRPGLGSKKTFPSPVVYAKQARNNTSPLPVAYAKE